LKDRAAFDRVMSETKFDAVIHFAALKAVGESTQKPLEYYDNNLGSLFNLLFAMKKYGVDKIGKLEEAEVMIWILQLPF
jgi:UDP-glucose 4-epimerase